MATLTINKEKKEVVKVETVEIESSVSLNLSFEEAKFIKYILKNFVGGNSESSARIIADNILKSMDTIKDLMSLKIVCVKNSCITSFISFLDGTKDYFKNDKD